MDKDVYNEALAKYDKYTFEYERRFITSLAVFSTAGLAFCFTSSRFANDTDGFLIALLPSLWSFLGSILLSGVTPIIKSVKYKTLRDSIYGTGQAKEIVESGIELVSNLPSDIVSTMFKNDANKNFKLHRFWLWLSRFTLFTASILCLFAVAWPIILISTQGFIK